MAAEHADARYDAVFPAAWRAAMERAATVAAAESGHAGFADAHD
jgi:hypothetical protein